MNNLPVVVIAATRVILYRYTRYISTLYNYSIAQSVLAS